MSPNVLRAGDVSNIGETQSNPGSSNLAGMEVQAPREMLIVAMFTSLHIFLCQ